MQEAPVERAVEMEQAHPSVESHKEPAKDAQEGEKVQTQ